ncbi:unnamed protein product [Trichobilharzia regenti]|nr:unnamed protein product [Trichobilharzia regenti]
MNKFQQSTIEVSLRYQTPPKAPGALAKGEEGVTTNKTEEMSAPEEKKPPRPSSPKPASIVGWLSRENTQEKVNVEPQKKEPTKEGDKGVPEKKKTGKSSLALCKLICHRPENENITIDVVCLIMPIHQHHYHSEKPGLSQVS